MAKQNYKTAFIVTLVILLVAAALLVNSFMRESANQKNKELVAQLVEIGLETGDVDELIEANFAPDAVMEYPEGYHFPPTNTNVITGIDSIKTMVKSWKEDTMHQIDIVDTIAEDNRVAVLISMDRIFNTDEDPSTAEYTHEDHPAIYFFYFEEGKIVKVVCVFDILEHVEDFKTEKYG